MGVIENLNLALRQALDRNDYDEVARLAGLIKRAKQLSDELNVIANSVEPKEAGSQEDHNFTQSRIDQGEIKKSISGRAKGKEARETYLEKLRKEGVVLTRKKGSIYTTHTGHSVGIAYSSQLPGPRWWLGLKNVHYSSIIFLCEEKTRIVSFVIPQDRIDAVLRGTSISKENDFKFNILLEENTYRLTLPHGDDDIILNAFMDKTDTLKKLAN